MSLYTPLTQAQLLGDFSTTYANAAELPANQDAPSTVGAIGTAVARVGERIDTQIEYIANIARFATSATDMSAPVGPDVASFAAPFGIVPIGAIPSTGTLTLGTQSVVSSALLIPVGAIYTTATGLQFLVVTPSATNAPSSWNGSSYQINAGASSANVLAQCLTAGSIGKVQAGTITLPYNAPNTPSAPGISSITNTLAFGGGSDAETNGAFMARFTQTVSSGRVGTNQAIMSAIASVQTGLTYQVGDAIDPNGSTHAAHVSVIVDVLGTSSGPPASLITAVTTAINGGSYNGVTYPQVRSAGITLSVQGPTEVPVSVTATLKLAAGAISASVITAAQAALAAYLNNLGLSPLNAATVVPYYQVIAILAGVSGVAYPESGVVVNGAAVDLSIPFASRPVAGTFTITTA